MLLAKSLAQEFRGRIRKDRTDSEKLSCIFDEAGGQKSIIPVKDDASLLRSAMPIVCGVVFRCCSPWYKKACQEKRGHPVDFLLYCIYSYHWFPWCVWDSCDSATQCLQVSPSGRFLSFLFRIIGNRFGVFFEGKRLSYCAAFGVHTSPLFTRRAWNWPWKIHLMKVHESTAHHDQALSLHMFAHFLGLQLCKHRLSGHSQPYRTKHDKGWQRNIAVIVLQCFGLLWLGINPSRPPPFGKLLWRRHYVKCRGSQHCHGEAVSKIQRLPPQAAPIKNGATYTHPHLTSKTQWRSSQP